MPDFSYIAKSKDGERMKGVLAAGSRREAMQQLRSRSLFPMEVKDVSSGVKLPDQLSGLLKPKVKKEAISDLCTQLADLLNNGVPLLEALASLAEASVNVRLQEALRSVHDSVAEGANLDAAMAAHPDVFSELMLSMVRAGLEGAFLEEALERTAGFLQKQDELRAKIVSSLTYPMILGGAGTVITAGLIVFLVPKFQPFFDRLEASGSGLPLVTVILLALSDTLLNYGLLIVLGLVGAFMGVQRFFKTPQGKRRLDRWKLKLPVFGQIFHDAAVSRFCRVLGTLLRNGVPLLRSLRISGESTGNALLADAVSASADNVTSGDSLSKPLAASGLIPKQIMAMIRIAEESNTLDHVLVNIANRMDQRIERRLEVMVRMIEPLMLVMIGSMVMFVIVGVLLPVFDLNSSVG